MYLTIFDKPDPAISQILPVTRLSRNSLSACYRYRLKNMWKKCLCSDVFQSPMYFLSIIYSRCQISQSFLTCTTKQGSSSVCPLKMMPINLSEWPHQRLYLSPHDDKQPNLDLGSTVEDIYLSLNVHWMPSQSLSQLDVRTDGCQQKLILNSPARF